MTLGKKSMYLESYHPDSLQRIYELEAPKRRHVDIPDQPITAPYFTSELTSYDGLKEGQTVHLECQVQPMNDPNMRIEWLHNGKPLTAGHRFRTIHDFSYVALDILYVYPEGKTIFYLSRIFPILSVKTIQIAYFQGQLTKIFAL